jgi:hypothetical protein
MELGENERRRGNGVRKGRGERNGRGEKWKGRGERWKGRAMEGEVNGRSLGEMDGEGVKGERVGS